MPSSIVTEEDLAKMPQMRVYDHPVDHPPLMSGHEAVWHPLDTLVGHCVVTSPFVLNIDSVNAHLQGRRSLSNIALHYIQY